MKAWKKTLPFSRRNSYRSALFALCAGFTFLGAVPAQAELPPEVLQQYDNAFYFGELETLVDSWDELLFRSQFPEVSAEAFPLDHFQGLATYYSRWFHGRKTASGERHSKREFVAAHRSLPFGTLVRVTNPTNGKQVVVRINDRGPFGRGRVLDLSYEAAREIGMIGVGVARIEAEVLAPPMFLVKADPAPEGLDSLQ